MYTKEDIQNLITDLKSYGHTYEVVIDFFEYHLNEGHFNFGLSKPGTQSSAYILKELEKAFPDVAKILFEPKENLPLFIDKSPDLTQEYSIACWRLKIDK